MRRLTFSAKCNDMFGGTITTDDNEYDIDGYVPSGLGLGDDGDYIEMTIDLDTGQILNWKPVTDEAIEEAING